LNLLGHSALNVLLLVHAASFTDATVAAFAPILSSLSVNSR
jgi:hypothetical protein